MPAESMTPFSLKVGILFALVDIHDTLRAVACSILTLFRLALVPGVLILLHMRLARSCGDELHRGCHTETSLLLCSKGTMEVAILDRVGTN